MLTIVNHIRLLLENLLLLYVWDVYNIVELINDIWYIKYYSFIYFIIVVIYLNRGKKIWNFKPTNSYDPIIPVHPNNHPTKSIQTFFFLFFRFQNRGSENPNPESCIPRSPYKNIWVNIFAIIVYPSREPDKLIIVKDEEEVVDWSMPFESTYTLYIYPLTPQWNSTWKLLATGQNLLRSQHMYI